MQKYVWMNKNGKFMRLSESNTHTGKHVSWLPMDKLDLATVFSSVVFPLNARMYEIDMEDFLYLPVVETRTIKIGTSNE